MASRQLPAQPPSPDAPARDKITVLLDAALIERVRAAAWYLRVTISEIAAPALERELARLERQHGPFPERGGPVKTGRPMKKPKRRPNESGRASRAMGPLTAT